MQTGSIRGLDKPVPRLVMGSMVIKSTEETQSFELLDAARASGWSAIDTAHIYGGGESERTIGKWLVDRGCRDEVIILTKGAHPTKDRKRVTSFDIASDLHDSLARLHTDFIDLYLLHRDDPELPVGPIIEAMNEHIAAGRVRAIGASNWTHQRIGEANEYADKHGLDSFALSSPNYSLAAQLESPWGPDCQTISGPGRAEARAWYLRAGMPLFTWSSLARGFFSGRLKSGERDRAEDVIEKSSVLAYAYDENFQRLARAEKLAETRGVTVPQIALAYVLAQPLNVFPIVWPATPDELAASAQAAEIRLTEDECAWLDLRGEAPASAVQ